MKKTPLFLSLCCLFSCWIFPQTEAVGRVAGELAVSSTGAVTYLVPIAVPPGIKEVVPTLALSYNSQAGDGIAGWGWNIAGLSTISRIGATQFHDGVIDPVDFDALDRFALDGQRLILVEGEGYGIKGAVYRTENYSNIKIIGHGATYPDGVQTHTHFTVIYPDGSQAVYGKNYPAGRNDLEWAINYWEDPQGNRIKYDYIEDANSTYLITSIGYGGTNVLEHMNEIRFNYEERSQKESYFMSGKQFKRTKRLSSIEVFSQGEKYRNYTIAYSQTSRDFDRIHTIEESVEDEDKPLIYFDYMQETYEEHPTIASQIENVEEVLAIEKDNLLTGDFNGDGQMDYVIQPYKTSAGFNYIFSTEDEQGRRSFSSSININQSYGNLANIRQKHNFITTTGQEEGLKISNRNSITRISELTTHETPIYYTNESQRSTVEFTSFLLKEDNSTSSWKKTWYNVPVSTVDHCGYEYNTALSKSYLSGDFNGDGILDALVYQKAYRPLVCEERNNCSCSAGEEKPAKLYWVDLKRNNQSNFVHLLPDLEQDISINDRIYTLDYNADGMTDLLHFNESGVSVYTLQDDLEWKIIVDNVSLFRFDLNFPLFFGDYNGDGQLDFLHPHGVYSSEWTLYTATGTGFSAFKDFNFPVVFIPNDGDNEQQRFYIPQDVDGDGKTDLIYHQLEYDEKVTNSHELTEDAYNVSPEIEVSNRGTLSVYSKKIDSNRFELRREENVDFTEHSGGQLRVHPIPIPPYQKLGQNQYGFLVGDHLFQKPFLGNHRKEVLLEIVTHKGLAQKIEYQALSSSVENSSYFPGEAQVYPYVTINHAPNLYLVRKVTATANGQTATQKFKYKGAVSHAGGLGFLGFLATGRTNSYGTNVRALWNVSQHDPQKRGAVTQSWTSVFNHLSLPNQTSQYSSYEYSTSTTEKGVFINVPSSVLTEDHLMGFETLQTYTYDDYYNPSRILTERGSTSSPQGTTEQSYTYNNNPTATDATYHIGRLKSETATETWNGKSHTTTTEYIDYDNNLLEKMRLKGNNTAWLTETMTYDAYGNLLSKTLSAEGETDRSQSYTYTDDGRFLESSTDIEGLTTSFTYYPEGTLKTETSPFDHVTTYTYDAWQRPHTATDYLSNTATTTYHWDLNDLVETRTGADGSQSLSVIDPWGRERFNGQLLLNQWSYTATQYDVAGRVVMQTEPYQKNPATVVFRAAPYRDNAHTYTSMRNYTSYETYGRISSKILATGKTISTTYTRGSPTTSVNDGYQTVSTTLDARGKIAAMTDPNGTINYTYHPTGELEESNYDGHIVRVGYDGWGRKTSLSDPSAGDYSYQYDIFGQLTTETAPTGTTTYGYDAQGKLEWKKQIGDHTNLYTDYEYKPTTKQLDKETTTDALSGDTYSKTFAYDSYERLEKLTERNTIASFEQSFTFDDFGRIDTDTRSAEAGNSSQEITLTHNYAANGQLNKLIQEHPSTSSEQTLWELKTQNARGQATSIALGNGITKTNSYDAWGFLDKTNQDDALSLELKYDKKKGVLTSRTRNGHATESFRYDSRNRLTRIQKDSLILNQSYDDYGRLKENPRLGEYHYLNEANRYRMDSIYLNAQGFKYYEEHPKQEVAYNIDRKATTVHEEGHGRADFFYNADMQRVHAYYGNEEEALEDRTYSKHYSTIFPAEITLSESSEDSFVFFVGGDAYTAPVAIINGEDHYLHRDHLGSILAISDASGTVVEERQFTAWGAVEEFKKEGIVQEKFEDSILPRGFTGHEHFTEIALIHMNGRLYDPQLKRFLSPDNNIQDPYDTRSYDRFSYVWHNPLMNSDPSGEFIVAALIGAAIGILTNGINNTINGRGFFEGAFRAAIVGAISGAISFGIGEAAAGIKASLISSGVSKASSALITGAFQTVAHGTLGGINSVFNGGGFGSGFLSGAAGSVAGGLGGKAFAKAGRVLKGVGTTITGGVAGGLASSVAGGNFWDGFRNGAISAGLNHAVHSGFFGENLAAASITGKLRHLFGADAIAVSGNAAAGMGGGIKVEKGGIAILRGKDAGEFIGYDDIGAGASTPSASATAGVTKLYYSGSRNFSHRVFFGPRNEFNLSFDAGLSVGATAIYASVENNFIIGFGVTAGFGASATFLDVNFNLGKTSITNPWKYNKK